MLRALWFAVKIGLIAAAALWVSRRPGTVELDWLGYHVTAHVGIALLALLVLLFVILFLHRLVLAVSGLPKAWKKRRERNRQDKGYRALTQGLTAVAAGDAKEATGRALKTRELWPQDQGLSLLLEAQAARLRGEPDIARTYFDRLLKNKDTAFLGLRGLLAAALENGDTAQALALAQKARDMYPRQPWIVRMVYDLQIQEKQWIAAEKTMKQAIGTGALKAESALPDKIALLTARADEEQEHGRSAKAVSLLRKAYKANPAFAPVAARLADLYMERGNRNAAKNILEKTWKACPHPDLIPLWSSLSPRGKPGKTATGKLRWFEKLVALRPDSAEGQMAAAQAALEESLWGQARQYLDRAEQIGHSARLFRLYARLEESLGHAEEAREQMDRAVDAPPDKVWTCRETGNIYPRWMPIATLHGGFNTIVWDYPRAGTSLAARTLLPQNEILITARAETQT